MTQVEFTERTQVNVSSQEFNAINEVYMASDLDKDEFCKVWKKMNASRVKVSIQKKRENEKRYQTLSRIRAIIEKYQNDSFEQKCRLAIRVLTQKEYDFIESLGIELVMTKFYAGVTMLDVIFDLGEKTEELIAARC